MITQSQEIIRYMQEKGSITAFDAVLDLSITQLSSRLVGLEKRGYEFNKQWVKLTNRYGRKIQIVRYSLKKMGERL